MDTTESLIDLVSALCTTGTWFDLSHEIAEGLITGPGIQSPELRTVELDIPLPEGRVQVTNFCTSTHAGTHVDAPSHYFPDAPTVTDLGIDAWVGEGVILDMRRTEPQFIDVEDLEAKDASLIRPGDIVFMRTGWGAKFRAGDAAGYNLFPGLSVAAAEWFVDRGVRMVGADTRSPDPPHEFRPAGYAQDVHRVLLGNGILIAENLYLEDVKQCRALIVAAPIQLEHADGGPARIMAWLPHESIHRKEQL